MTNSWSFVIFHLFATRFFTDTAQAKANLLLFGAHLHDLELVLRTDLESGLLALLVDCLGDVAETLHTLGDLDECAELCGAQYLALDHVTHTVLRKEGIPNIGLQLLHTE